jgi:partner of Y14 and mago
MPPKQAALPSGIQTGKDGHRVIPASVRPDGSIRAERRVREGYTPAEDVATYKSDKAESFRSHQYGHKDYVPPGLAKVVPTEDKKRRRPKKKTEGEKEDPEKKARALKKKIRQATELKERVAKGDKLEESQIAKIGMLETFEKELAALNIDTTEEA